MNLRQSERQQAKIKIAVQGVSGSGKTYSSLLMAYGMAGAWNKVAVIDSENGSADLYAHLGAYNVITMDAPHTPEKYIQAIEVCEKEGMEVIIIDSISHCWDYLLEYHSSLTGNSFTNWSKVTPRQNAFIQKILRSSAHVICTMRTKQDYVLSERNGKMVPEKVGLKAVMRDGIDYEFTIVFEIDIKHNASASKDRTGLFMGKPENTLTVGTGKAILNWCHNGTGLEQVSRQIQQATTLEALYALYDKYPQWQSQLVGDFTRRKQSIVEAMPSQGTLTPLILNNHAPSAAYSS